MDTLFILNTIAVRPFTIELAAVLVGIVILLCMSAFVSGSEVGFFSLTPQDQSDMELANTEADQNVFKLQKKMEHLLATILIANNLVNVAIVVLTAFFIESLFDFSQSPLLGFLIQTVVITFFLLLFGEIMPKVYATQNPVKMARASAKALLVLNKGLYPFSTILVHSTQLVNKRLIKHKHNSLSIDELSEALELTTHETNEEKEILKGIVSFGSTTVDAVMTSRLDMVTIDIKTPYREILKVIEEHGYSRIPVFSDSQDHIRGILYIKDLLSHLAEPNTFKWQKLIRPPFFVPNTKKIDDLLREFQKNKIHVAIVVDEFGGTLGLVTMEDILEEIVGDISDEHDEEDPLFTRIDPFTYLFEAKIPLNDFFKATHIDQEVFAGKIDEVDSLAGLVLELKGEFPAQNECVTFANYVFEILSVDNRRIKKIKLYIKPTSSEKDA